MPCAHPTYLAFFTLSSLSLLQNSSWPRILFEKWVVLLHGSVAVPCHAWESMRAGLAILPPTAIPILRQLRLLSLDLQLLIKSAAVLREATRLHTLYLAAQDVVAEEAEMEAAVDVLRALQVCSAD